MRRGKHGDLSLTLHVFVVCNIRAAYNEDGITVLSLTLHVFVVCNRMSLERHIQACARSSHSLFTSSSFATQRMPRHSLADSRSLSLTLHVFVVCNLSGDEQLPPSLDGSLSLTLHVFVVCNDGFATSSSSLTQGRARVALTHSSRLRRLQLSDAWSTDVRGAQLSLTLHVFVVCNTSSHSHSFFTNLYALSRAPTSLRSSRRLGVSKRVEKI